jgi:hypothetical protein
MKKINTEKWVKVRQQGMVSFVLTRGILWWAIPVSVFMIAFNYSVYGLTGWGALRIFLFACFGGLIFYIWLWRFMEGAYHEQHLEKEQ